MGTRRRVTGGAVGRLPSRAPRARRRRVPMYLAAGLGALALLLVGVGLGDVVLEYQTSDRAASTASPLKFVDGGNYAAAHTQGLVTNTYPNAQQVSVAVTVDGASGAYGTYVLDTLEVQPTVTTTATWHLHLDVTTALVATGVNAAYLFYCTSAPTAVPDTGASLASGTDANGNPWAIFAPTCAGTQVSLALTAVASGTVIALTGLTSGTSVLFLSFAMDVTNTGATTTTNAQVTLEATSP
jgi:hypothetical protein